MTALRREMLARCIMAAICTLSCSETRQANPTGTGGSAEGSNGPGSSGSTSTGGTTGSDTQRTVGSNNTKLGGAGSSARVSTSITGVGSTGPNGTQSTGGTQSTDAPGGSGGSKTVTLPSGGRNSDTRATTLGGTTSTSLAPASGGTAMTHSSSSPQTAPAGVKINGRQLFVGGQPFRIRGVCWNPVPKGKNHPEGIDYAGLAPKDIALMKAAHINAVRTYEPLTNLSVLDQLADAGIYVLNSVYPYGGAPAGDVTARVNAVKNHRAILFWVIGNEWNYNGLYVDLPAAEARARLNEVATLIRAADPNHPIASVYGELPPKDVVEAMPNIDIWGVNVYSGITFGDRFTKWASTSNKPMFLAEYGADAFNANKGAYDPESQAEASEALTREIAAQCSDTNPNGVALGGTIFEWADEWWKASGGSLDVHDNGGVAPGGGPYPDSTFNEEWWGIVDIDRNPRPAYDVLKSLYGA